MRFNIIMEIKIMLDQVLIFICFYFSFVFNLPEIIDIISSYLPEVSVIDKNKALKKKKSKKQSKNNIQKTNKTKKNNKQTNKKSKRT